MKLYAVFGNPIAHSKSPFLHNFAFEALKIDARFVRYKLESAERFRELFFALGLSGANITVPFKEILLKYCDEVDSIAQKIGAINTIVRRENRLFGYNTDALGFYENIKGETLQNALIIGAGGSARAIAFILREKNIAPFIINRSEKRLEFFAQNGFECASFGEFFAQNNFKASFDGFCERFATFDLIINATSSSINDELPLEESCLIALFSEAKIALDLMYGKKCPFLELAKKAKSLSANRESRVNLDANRISNRINSSANCGKIRTIDGANMLLYQAIYASSLFLDKPTSALEGAFLKAQKLL